MSKEQDRRVVLDGLPGGRTLNNTADDRTLGSDVIAMVRSRVATSVADWRKSAWPLFIVDMSFPFILARSEQF